MPRLPIAFAVVLIVASGLGVRALWDGPVPKYAGDALYTALIYALVVFILPKVRPWVAAAVSAGLSWAIEFAQLGDIPPLLRPLLGSTFNPPDLFWYAVGAAICWAVHAWWLRRGSRPSRSTSHRSAGATRPSRPARNRPRRRPRRSA